MQDPLLSLRINDGNGNDRHVKYRDLSFRKGSHGGMLSLKVTIITATGDFTGLGPSDRIYLYDRTGTVVWEGYLDNPGATNSPGGSEYQIIASGPATLASDAATARIWVDTALDGWKRSQYSTKGAVLGNADIDDDTPCLQTTAPKDTDITQAGNVTYGTALVTNARWTGDWIYRGVRRAGQRLSRISCTVRAGVTSSNFTYGIRTRVGAAGSSGFIDSATASPSSDDLEAEYGDTFFGASDDVANLRVARFNTDATGVEAHVFQFYDVVVRALLKDATGADITTGYTADTVLSHEVIADMVGSGMLPGIDGARVSIAAGSDTIDQLAWPDGITAAGVLDALIVYEPDLVWRYGTSSAAGHSFDAYFWDDENPRYELDDTRDGVTIPGGDNELCNRIVVGYTDRKGVARTVKSTSEVAELADGGPLDPDDPGFIGRVRDADSITIPDAFGTATGAAALGERILARKATQPLAGTAIVRRPILDSLLGRYVMPFEVEPGFCVRRRSTGDIIRLTEVDYQHNDRSATLTLGSPTLTAEQLLADLTKRGPMMNAKQVTPGLLTGVHHLKGTKKKKG